MSQTLYVLTTTILFILNLLGNVLAMSLNKSNKFPSATFLATVTALFFIVWGMSILL